MKKKPDIPFCRTDNLGLLSRISYRMLNSTSLKTTEGMKEVLGYLGGENQADITFFHATDLSAKETSQYYEWHHDRHSAPHGELPPVLRKLQDVLFVVKKERETIFLDRDASPGSYGSISTDLLRITGMQSLLIQPIFFHTMFGGLLGMGCRQSRSAPCRTEGQYLQLIGNILLSVCTQPQSQAQERKFDLQGNCAVLKQVLDHLPDCLYVKDMENRYILANQAQILLFGKNAMEELVGKTDFDIYPRDLAQRFYDDECKILRTGEPILDREEPGIDREGNPICVSTTKVPLRDEHGHMLGLLGVSRNITERKKLQAEILHGRKMESLGVVVGGISNDLNNLLTAIMGSISLAKIYLPPEDPAFQRLTQAQDACNNGKEISNRLFHFAKGIEPVKKVVRLEHLLREEIYFSLTTLPAGATTIQCNFHIEDDLHPVAIDERQFTQVINHLVKNAVEAMPQGGALSIRARNVASDKSNCAEDTITRLLSGECIVMSIEDEGVGIPKEIIHKIFDPYFSTKETPGETRGRGLGLAVCHSIIKKHGGILHIDSQPGVGTKVCIHLPAVLSRKKSAASLEAAPALKKKRILIMDDEIFVRTVAGEMLTHMGFEVEYTGDGQEAVDAYRTAMEAGNDFSLVILDLFVTGGTGGEEAMQKLLDIDPHIKGIVSTGFWDDPVARQYRHYGFQEVIQKPFSMEQLSEVIRRVLNE